MNSILFEINICYESNFHILANSLMKDYYKSSNIIYSN